jgi:hypothetical protein
MAMSNAEFSAAQRASDEATNFRMLQLQQKANDDTIKSMEANQAKEAKDAGGKLAKAAASGISSAV